MGSFQRCVHHHYLFDKEDDNYVFSTGYAQLRTKVDCGYLFTLIQSSTFVQKVLEECTGTSYPSINPTSLSKINVKVVENSDIQKKISCYFKNFDLLIQSTAKKIESLKQVKAASMQSMFPAVGERRPIVRFCGFNDDWKRVKLSECLDISKDINSSNAYSKEDVLSVSEEAGVVNQIEYLGRSYAGKSVSNYKILKKGQIVYTKSPLKAKPFGIIKENIGETGIVSVLYAIYNVKTGVDASYLHYYFDPSWRLNNYIRPLVNKGAKNTMNISDETALEGYIYIPSYHEQQKIASFFSNLDKQISLYEQRLGKLKNIKSACLDGMFV